MRLWPVAMAGESVVHNTNRPNRAPVGACRAPTGVRTQPGSPLPLLWAHYGDPLLQSPEAAPKLGVPLPKAKRLDDLRTATPGGVLDGEGAVVTAQVVKTSITLQLATADRLREAETAPLHPVGRLHMRR
jgi:hypothetical protein